MLQKIIIAIVCTSNLLNAKTLTLEDLKKDIQNKSYDLLGSKEMVMSAEMNIKTEKATMFPKFGVSLGSGFINSKDLNEQEKIQAIYGEINLFNGFKDLTNSLISKNHLEQTRNNLKNKIFQKELKIEQLYYQLLFLKKKIQLLESELKRSDSHIKMVKKRLSSNIITETDLLEFKIYRKKLFSLQTYANLNSLIVKNQLLMMTSFDSEENVSIKGALPHYIVSSNLSNLIKLGSESFNVKDQDLKMDLANLELERNEASWYPKINLKIEHGHLDEVETGVDSDVISSKAVVLATWELFSGGGTVYKQKSLVKKARAQEYSRKQTLQDYKIKVINLFHKLKMLEQAILSEEENAIMSRELYQRTLREYKKGIKDSGALSNSSKEFGEIESRVYQLKFNYINEKIQLEKIIGKRLEFKNFSHSKE